MGWQSLPAEFDVQPAPWIDWDRANNRLYVIYADKTNSDVNISLRWSTNAGANWSSSITVNDDSSGLSQFQPHLAVDQSRGYVGAWWYDARDNSSSTNGSVRTYAAVSRDLFATQPKNFLLNAPACNDDVFEFKEYVGGAFFNGWFFPAWPDSSNSTGDNPDGTSKSEIHLARLPY
jgi:hypothetical protein